jgi:hypothetical protein
MTAGIGAAGILGVAFETTPNTYVAPAKFIPFLSETMVRTDDQQWRRSIRATPDNVGVVGGNVNTAGDINIEALEDCIVYFLRAARTAMVKTGTTPNWSYAFTPTATAVPAKTLSITIVRNGIVFGYVGCITSSFSFTVSDGLLQATFSMIGSDETTQSLPSATWPTTAPYGAGTYNIQIPTSTTVLDADTFTFTVDDSGTPQFRMSTTRGAQYVAFGERTVTLTVDRDFLDKTQYADFIANTAQTITLVATKGANNSITFLLGVATQTEYPVNIGSQGDLVRTTTNFTSSLDSGGLVYTITVATQEVIT